MRSMAATLVTTVGFLLSKRLCGHAVRPVLTDMELSVVVVLFASLLFLLFVLLYVGGR
jgi:hypothetical protein